MPRPQCDFRLAWPRRAALSLCAATALIGGCSVQHDPDYNPYAPPGGEPGLMEAADRATEFLSESLDNLDMRLENAVY